LNVSSHGINKLPSATTSSLILPTSPSFKIPNFLIGTIHLPFLIVPGNTKDHSSDSTIILA